MKYLINETTKVEREKIVYKALGIFMSVAIAPSKDAMNLMNKYIEGKMEFEEVQKQILNTYKKKEAK